jgi:hypothetical protein
LLPSKRYRSDEPDIGFLERAYTNTIVPRVNGRILEAEEKVTFHRRSSDAGKLDASRPQEQNFALTINDLAVVAEKVWRRQNFIP